jgi:hypothetical protein
MVESEEAPDAILLSIIVMKCIDANIQELPEELIAKYARCDMAGLWEMYAAYYCGMIAAGHDMASSEGAGVFANSLNRKCLELLEPGSFSDSEVFRLAPGALYRVQDSVIATELAGRVLSADVEMPSLLYLSQLAASGQAIMENEAAPAHEFGELFEQKINAALEDVRDEYPAEMYESTIRRWRMAYAKRGGASPEELLGIIYAEFAGMAHVAAESQDEDEAARGIVQYMDQIIVGYALSYASAKNFSAARVFLSGLANSDLQTAVLQRCLDYVTAGFELHDLTSELDIFRMNPDLQLNTAIFEAGLRKDAPQLASLALDTAYSIELGLPGEVDSLKGTSVGRAFQLFAELMPQQTPLLAKQLLEIMRLRNQSGAQTYYLSSVLIRAGDTEEALKAYEEICSDIPDSDKKYRLPRLQMLASDLS